MAIAMILNCHKLTTSCEIHCNTDLRGYRPQQAQELTEECRLAKAHPRIGDSTWADVGRLLR